MIEIRNIYKDLPDASSNEVFQQIFDNEFIKIERIISKGQSSPDNFWYDQMWGEWVLLIEGFAKLEFQNDGIIGMSPGDYLYIPPNKKHRIIFTTPDKETIWLTIFIKSL